ncbi:DNA-binding transcriptional regulator [Paenibacillus odorifer]|uniref:helix-turn-helix transcriptional regulator n=1 Tax=Paenibacillus TaxID=44249 RepID=UPI00096CE29B|nr:YafY family protein [Paenibacillus odorifer]OMC79462.1 DNA-binding transcriptional regulator [Paenibacillus odorifer]OMD97522.1 DNA-binding transcriptional regulator [Paenibacillus odorifer]
MSKADHMLSILWMLKQRGRTAGELAEALEISVRSVYRYIDALCISGVPIIADSGPGGGYSLPEHFSEVPLFFDSDEQRSLLQAASFARGTGYPYVEALDQAIAKLKRYSNAQQLEQMERHESGIETIHSPAAPLPHLLQELELATANGHTLQMEYRKGNGETISSRAIDPYGLVLWKGQWYTVAYCHQRQEIRSFRVDRITELHRTEALFARPADFSARDFLLKSLLPTPNTPEKLIAVVIAADEGILNDLCSHWLFGHTLVQRIDGQARFQVDETSLLTYAPYFLLPYGSTLRILEPLALKQKLSAIATDLAAYYKT